VATAHVIRAASFSVMTVRGRWSPTGLRVWRMSRQPGPQLDGRRFQLMPQQWPATKGTLSAGSRDGNMLAAPCCTDISSG
jgi:hypothetical protein